ncbi:unnamed protein product [Phaedon cochleariae]|uniref:Protein CNPPD1 n=1 Tax=Phaedon cochleariae TaxID=80249 RepID=A0A9N9SF15_PHACE|nr:unnamed protein product [Phaedon cochleariae]
MSKISNKKSPKTIGDHQKYLSRITKTLYYGKLPKSDCLSFPVTELAAELFSEAHTGKSLERLHLYDAANISRNTCVSPCSLVLAMLYLERLKNRNPGYLEKTVPSDLFLVSLMVSSKFLFDDGEPDEVFIDEWATSGGVKVRDLVLLERDFLKAMDWEIFVSEPTFWKKLNDLEITLASKQGTSRGYFTYTELQSLSQTVDISNLIHCIAAVSVILAATYTAGLLTILGSVFLASQIPGTSLYAKETELKELSPALNIQTNLDQDIKNTTKTEIHSKYVSNKKSDIIDVLRTSFLLASIQPNSTEDVAIENDVQYITWDYWNIPIMDWLAKSSDAITTYTAGITLDYFPYYLDTISNSKTPELNHIHKATKTRIQDQMESSWHEEWVDSLTYRLSFNTLFSYVNNIKA